MAFTEEQRRKAVETRKRKAAARAEQAAAPPDAGAEHLPAESNLLKEFADFARILGDADTERAQQDAAIDGIETLLGSLKPGDYPKLAEHPVVQKFVDLIAERKAVKGERVPGMVVGDGLAQRDEPWRMEDVMKRATDPTHPDYEAFKLVEWPGRETIYLGWNGLAIWVFEDRPTLIPKVFMDVYNEHRRQLAAAKQHQDYLFAARGKFGGSGPDGVPADPTIMAGPGGVRTRMLRGQFSGGDFTPGKGLEIDVPDADRPGLDSVEEGEPAGAAA